MCLSKSHLLVQAIHFNHSLINEQESEANLRTLCNLNQVTLGMALNFRRRGFGDLKFGSTHLQRTTWKQILDYSSATSSQVLQAFELIEKQKRLQLPFFGPYIFCLFRFSLMAIR